MDGIDFIHLLEGVADRDELGQLRQRRLLLGLPEQRSPALAMSADSDEDFDLHPMSARQEVLGIRHRHSVVDDGGLGSLAPGAADDHGVQIVVLVRDPDLVPGSHQPDSVEGLMLSPQRYASFTIPAQDWEPLDKRLPELGCARWCGLCGRTS